MRTRCELTVTEALVLRPLLEDREYVTVNPYNLGARRQNETKMISDHDETSPSIAAVTAPSVACSMFAMQQQKRLCRQFIDVSAARRGAPHDETRSADRPGIILATDVRRSEIYAGVCPRSDL